MLRIRTTGAQWHLMPGYYRNCNTVSRRFQQWCQRDVLTQLANALREEEAMTNGRASSMPPLRSQSESSSAGLMMASTFSVSSSTTRGTMFCV